MSFFRLSAKSKFIASAACLAMLVLIVSCGSDSITSSLSDSAPPGSVVENPQFIQLLPAAKGGPTAYMRASATSLVTVANGGVVDNGVVRLEFAPGAVSEDTDITLNMVNETALLVELAPHGLQFNAPVTMRFDLTNSLHVGNAANCSMLWYDGGLEAWTVLATTPVDPNTLETPLHHFSKYGGVAGEE